MSHIKIKILDTNNNIVKEREYPFRSFTMNFIRGIRYAMAGGVPSFPAFTHQDGDSIYNDNLTGVLNPAVDVTTSGSPNPFYYQSCGIRCAFRTTLDLDIDPETIEGLIANGTEAGQLHHALMNYHGDSENLIIVNRPFINLSGGTISVNSVALMTYCNVGNFSPNWKQLPVAIDWLDDVLEVENHQLIDVTYCIETIIEGSFLYPSRNFSSLIKLTFGQEDSEVAMPLLNEWFYHWKKGSLKTVIGKITDEFSKLKINRDVSEGEDGGIILGSGRSSSTLTLSSPISSTYSDTEINPITASDPNIEIEETAYHEETIASFYLQTGVIISGFSALSDMQYLDSSGDWQDISASDDFAPTEDVYRLRVSDDSHIWECDEGDGWFLIDRVGDVNLTLSSSSYWKTSRSNASLLSYGGNKLFVPDGSTDSYIKKETGSWITGSDVWTVAFRVIYRHNDDSFIRNISSYKHRIYYESSKIKCQCNYSGYEHEWSASLSDGDSILIRAVDHTTIYCYHNGVNLGNGYDSFGCALDINAISYNTTNMIDDIRIWDSDIGDTEAQKYHSDTMTSSAPNILKLSTINVTSTPEIGDDLTIGDSYDAMIPSTDGLTDVWGNSVVYDNPIFSYYKRVANFTAINSLTNDYDRTLIVNEGGLFGAGGDAVQADDSSLSGGPICFFKFQFAGSGISLEPGEKLYSKVFIGSEIEDYTEVTWVEK